MVGVVQYGAGNPESVMRALDFLGHNSKVVLANDDLQAFDGVVIPGVGSFPQAMTNLEQADFATRLSQYVSSGKPVLGICLGMQLLFEHSEEGVGAPGLNLLGGRVVQSSSIGMDPEDGGRIGWRSTRFIGAKDSPHLFYAHSFEVVNTSPTIVLGVSSNGGRDVISAVARGNLVGFQFHPEKSGPKGLALLDKALLGEL
jgi:glutamine amidotransferase